MVYKSLIFKTIFVLTMLVTSNVYAELPDLGDFEQLINIHTSKPDYFYRKGLYNDDGDITLDAHSATQDTQVLITNSHASYEASADIEGSLTVNSAQATDHYLTFGDSTENYIRIEMQDWTSILPNFYIPFITGHTGYGTVLSQDVLGMENGLYIVEDTLDAGLYFYETNLADVISIQNDNEENRLYFDLNGSFVCFDDQVVIGVNTSAASISSSILEVDTWGGSESFSLVDRSGSNLAADFIMYQNDSGCLVDEELFNIILRARNSTPADLDFANFQYKLGNKTAGNESIRYYMKGYTGGTERTFLKFMGDEPALYLGNSNEPIDTIVDGDLYLENSLEVSGEADFLSDVTVTSTTTDKPDVQLINTTDDATSADLQFYNNRANPADNDVAGLISFYANDDNDVKTLIGQIKSIFTDVSDTSENSGMAFYLNRAGVQKNVITLYDTGLSVWEVLNTYSDVNINMNTAGEEVTFTQSSASGTEDVPMKFNNDDRTGATADEPGEATEVWEAEGTYAGYFKKGALKCDGSFFPKQVNDDAMDATAGTEGEIVYNLDDDKFYGCTATGDPATWAAFN